MQHSPSAVLTRFRDDSGPALWELPALRSPLGPFSPEASQQAWGWGTETQQSSHSGVKRPPHLGVRQDLRPV